MVGLLMGGCFGLFWFGLPIIGIGGPGMLPSEL